jgi:hypothetical protein
VVEVEEKQLQDVEELVFDTPCDSCGIIKRSWNSVIRIVNRLQAGQLRNWTGFDSQLGQGIFVFSEVSKPTLGLT